MQTPDPSTSTDALVAFASRHGATRGVAERIAARLHEGGLAVTLAAVEDVHKLPPGAAGVLGSPVYDGRWPPEFDAFVERHMESLVAGRTWLFSVGTFGDQRRLIGPVMLREPRNIARVRETMRAGEHAVVLRASRGCRPSGRRHPPRPMAAPVEVALPRLRAAIDEWAGTIADASASRGEPAGRR